MKNNKYILDKYKELVNNLNKTTTRSYAIHKLYVQKLNETQKNSIPESYCIYVIHEDSTKQLENDKKSTTIAIQNFRNYITKNYTEYKNIVDREIIKQLWRQWNKIFVAKFANVNYGNSHSVHKSQGSSFYNVFVDTDDILNNLNDDEAKRCIYTAFTRSSNELHILI